MIFLKDTNTILNCADFPTHLIHSAFNLGKESVELSFLVCDYSFKEDFILLDNGIIVRKVLFFDKVVKDSGLFSLKRPE